MVTLGFLLAFTLPLGYQKYRPAISATTARVSSVAKVRDTQGASRGCGGLLFVWNERWGE